MRGAGVFVVLLAAGALAATTAHARTGPAPPGPPLTHFDRLVDLGRPVYCGGRGKRIFALTFDDGPSPWTETLVAALRRGHAPATFFLVGNRIALWRADARAAAAYGAVGDHTWSHALLTVLPRKQIERQLTWTRQALEKKLGVTTRLFRPPYESANAKVETVVRSLGMLDVRWNVDSGDSRVGATPNQVVREILSGVRPGAIVLLHDMHPWTAEVVRRLLSVTRTRHLRPVTVPRLLNADPPGRNENCYRP